MNQESAMYDLIRFGVPTQKIIPINVLKGYQKLIDIGSSAKHLLIASSNVKLDLSNDEQINLVKSQFKKINGNEIFDGTVICLLMSEKLLDPNDDKDILNDNLPAPIAIPYSCHRINNSKIPGLFLSTTLTNTELQEISNVANKSIAPLEMIVTFNDDDSLLAYDIEPLEAEFNSFGKPNVSNDNDHDFKRPKLKYSSKPVGWEEVVKYYREHGFQKAVEEFSKFFIDEDVFTCKTKLKRWNESYKRLESNQFTNRKNGGVPSYGYTIDNQLANDCRERISKGLSINLIWLRQHLFTILKEHGLENTIMENGGKYAYKDSWAQRFYKRHNFPLNTRDKRKYEDMASSEADLDIEAEESD